MQKKAVKSIKADTRAMGQSGLFDKHQVFPD
jgi:hypothetical protein